jgi:class 3 adenylate cyclase
MSENKLHPDKNEIFKKKEDEIYFIRAQNCCVCFVDIVDSTMVTSSIINSEKIRKYYGTFLNTMAAIARNFRAKIIKNAGDCLIFCYPTPPFSYCSQD